MVRMVNVTRCAWVRHIPGDKRVAYEKALARKEWQGFPVEKSAVRLRLMEERGRACQICGLDRWLSEPLMFEMHGKNAG
jgi:hypothetical protein